MLDKFKDKKRQTEQRQQGIRKYVYETNTFAIRSLKKAPKSQKSSWEI